MSAYEILGLSRHATREEIHRAWQNFAVTGHPDRGGDRERWQQLYPLYKMLLDSARRADYDRGLPGEDIVHVFPVSLCRALAGGIIAADLPGKPLVRVPPSSLSGDELRITGKGRPGRPPGDLVLRLQVLPSPQWRLDDGELPTLRFDLPVTLYEFLEVGYADVETPLGPRRFPLRGLARMTGEITLSKQGISRGGLRGDIVATLEVEPPPRDPALSGNLMRLQGDRGPVLRAALTRSTS